MSDLSKLTKICIKCKKASTFSCSRCEDGYCSMLCQQADWQRHRYHCFPMPPLIPDSNTKDEAKKMQIYDEVEKICKRNEEFRLANLREQLEQNTTIIIPNTKPRNPLYSKTWMLPKRPDATQMAFSLRGALQSAARANNREIQLEAEANPPPIVARPEASANPPPIVARPEASANPPPIVARPEASANPSPTVAQAVSPANPPPTVAQAVSPANPPPTVVKAASPANPPPTAAQAASPAKPPASATQAATPVAPPKPPATATRAATQVSPAKPPATATQASFEQSIEESLPSTSQSEPRTTRFYQRDVKYRKWPERKHIKVRLLSQIQHKNFTMVEDHPLYDKECEQLTNDIADYIANNTETRYIPIFEELVLAKFENEYYRAMVLGRDTETNSYSVIYLDYGNVKDVQSDDMVAFPEFLLEREVFPIMCHVKNYPEKMSTRAEQIISSGKVTIDELEMIGSGSSIVHFYGI